jgi:hypothetical protein
MTSNAHFTFSLLVVLASAGCHSEDIAFQAIQNFPIETQVPQLVRGSDGEPILLFVESSDSTHALRWAQWSEGEWKDTTTVIEDSEMLVNWADRPQMAFDGTGNAYAHWLRMDARGDFAYQIRATRSLDQGKTWETPSQPHRDTSVAEHGFAQWLTHENGAALTWLDGRDFEQHPNPMIARMELRTAEWPHDQDWQEELVLDSSVCSCCPMDLAQLPDGSFELLYRDRLQGEIRDFSRSRYVPGDQNPWSSLGLLHADHWEIAACPVNGAALSASSTRALALWYSAADDVAIVKGAWRIGDSIHFGKPFQLNKQFPIGRVASACDQKGNFYGIWLETNETGGVDWVGMRWNQDGTPVTLESEILVPASERRAGGFPTMIGLEGEVMVAWTNPTPEPHIMTAIWKGPE